MKALKEKGCEEKDILLFFQDEMRYGLISNYRRSWSKKGERTKIKNQKQFENRYLYSSVSPITGESFHIYSFSDMNGITMQAYLDELQKNFKKKYIVLIWDGAPCHTLKAFRERKDMSIVPLPSYSPQLNPTERFFGEIRKGTANRIFESVKDQEKEIDTAVMRFVNNKTRLKKLIGYEWILEQWAMVF